MKQMPVTSSSLASVGYNPDTNTLEVVFRNGNCYQYYAVPQLTFDRLMAAASKGAYLNAYIKDRFPVTRVS